MSRHVGYGVLLSSIVALAGCATEAETSRTADTAQSADTEVKAGQPRVEYVCALPRGSVVEVHPSFGELHRIGLNDHTWEMSDGLEIKTSADSKVRVKDSETNETIAVLEPSASGIRYIEGETQGTCTKFELEKVPFTDKPFVLGKGLEYVCRVQDGVTLVVQPEFGEIAEISLNKGSYDSLDGMKFTLKSLERSPSINEISAVDDEGGTVGTISETATGATWRAEGQTGSCEKWKRTRKSP